jgi:hypothetical protein
VQRAAPITSTGCDRLLTDLPILPARLEIARTAGRALSYAGNFVLRAKPNAEFQYSRMCDTPPRYRWPTSSARYIEKSSANTRRISNG